MSKRRNARTNSIYERKKKRKKKSNDVHRGGKLVGGHRVHGMRRRISLSPQIFMTHVRRTSSQSSPSWRMHTAIYVYTPTHSHPAASFSAFFSSYIAPFPVSMHRSRRHAESGGALSRHELCFRNVRATHTDALSDTRAYLYVREHVRACAHARVY